MKRSLLSLAASPALLFLAFEVGFHVKAVLVSKTIPSCELMYRLLVG